MTDTEIEAMAHRMAWRYKKSRDPHHSDTYTFNAATVHQFVRKLIAAEREACAKVCDAKADAMWAWWDARADCTDQGQAIAAEELATEIRMRSNVVLMGAEGVPLENTVMERKD